MSATLCCCPRLVQRGPFAHGRKTASGTHGPYRRTTRHINISSLLLHLFQKDAPDTLAAPAEGCCRHAECAQRLAAPPHIPAACRRRCWPPAQWCSRPRFAGGKELRQLRHGTACPDRAPTRLAALLASSPAPDPAAARHPSTPAVPCTNRCLQLPSCCTGRQPYYAGFSTGRPVLHARSHTTRRPVCECAKCGWRVEQTPAVLTAGCCGCARPSGHRVALGPARAGCGQRHYLRYAPAPAAQPAVDCNSG